MLEVDECNSVTLISEEDGTEITITMRRDGCGQQIVSLYLDDGINICMIDLPRIAFDHLISEMRTLQ